MKTRKIILPLLLLSNLSFAITKTDYKELKNLFFECITPNYFASYLQISCTTPSSKFSINTLDYNKGIYKITLFKEKNKTASILVDMKLSHNNVAYNIFGLSDYEEKTVSSLSSYELGELITNNSFKRLYKFNGSIGFEQSSRKKVCLSSNSLVCLVNLINGLESSKESELDIFGTSNAFELALNLKKEQITYNLLTGLSKTSDKTALEEIAIELSNSPDHEKYALGINILITKLNQAHYVNKERLILAMNSGNIAEIVIDILKSIELSDEELSNLINLTKTSNAATQEKLLKIFKDKMLSPEQLEVLSSLANSSSWQVRRNMAPILAKSTESKDKLSIIKLAADNDNDVKNSVMPFYNQLQLSEQDLTFLESSLNSQQNSKIIVAALKKIGPLTSHKSDNLALEFKNHTSWEIRREVAKALAYTSLPEGKFSLYQLEGDRDTDVANSAAQSARTVKTQVSDLRYIKNTINSVSDNAKVKIIDSLKDIKSPTMVQICEQYYTSGSWSVRNAIAKTLIGQNSTKSKIILLSLSQDNDSDVSKSANASLNSVSFTANDIALMSEHINSKNDNVKKAFIRAVANVPSIEADKMAVRYATSSSWAVRQAVATALSGTEVFEGKSALLALANDSDNDVKNAATNSLRTIVFRLHESQQIVQALGSYSQSSTLALGIKKMSEVRSEEVFSKIRTFAKSSNWQVRQAIAIALNVDPSSEASKILVQLSQDSDTDVRNAALNSLRNRF